MCLLTRLSQSFDAFCDMFKPVYRNYCALRQMINVSELSGLSLDFASHQEETRRQHSKHKHAAGQRCYNIRSALNPNESGKCSSWPEVERGTLWKTLARP